MCRVRESEWDIWAWRWMCRWHKVCVCVCWLDCFSVHSEHDLGCWHRQQLPRYFWGPEACPLWAFQLCHLCPRNPSVQLWPPLLGSGRGDKQRMECGHLQGICPSAGRSRAIFRTWLLDCQFKEQRHLLGQHRAFDSAHSWPPAYAVWECSWTRIWGSFPFITLAIGLIFLCSPKSLLQSHCVHFLLLQIQSWMMKASWQCIWWWTQALPVLQWLLGKASDLPSTDIYRNFWHTQSQSWALFCWLSMVPKYSKKIWNRVIPKHKLITFGKIILPIFRVVAVNSFGALFIFLSN